MATIIDKMYEDHKLLHNVLLEHKEVSLASDSDNKLKKVLLVSAASYFEYEVANAVLGFANSSSNENPALLSLIKAKVIERQYHTYFQWEGQNANKFFSLFGERFLAECKASVKAQRDLDESIRAFLEIGSTRNQMMHENFSTFPMDKTAEEVYALYQRAEGFLDFVKERLASLVGVKPGTGSAQE